MSILPWDNFIKDCYIRLENLVIDGSKKELEEEWKDDDNHLKKIFKENIDPSVLAFLDLDEDDKLLLTN